jgi:hypothetical protein
MKIPDFISTIVAYRTWQWDAEGIASLNCVRWVPGEALTATCHNHIAFADFIEPHKTPDPRCSCGVYAAKNFEHLVQIGYAQHGIHGEVELWGTVMEHKLGWRAQFAYPKSFTVPEDMLPYQMPDLEVRLGMLSLYGVPIYFTLWRSPEAIPTSMAGLRARYEASRMLLWDKENGFSPEGVEVLAARARKWYEYKIENTTLHVGDRVFIKDTGIAIVHEEIGDKELRLQLFNRMLVRANRENIKWSIRNHRWETDQTNFAVSGLGKTL